MNNYRKYPVPDLERSLLQQKLLVLISKCYMKIFENGGDKRVISINTNLQLAVI